MSPSIPETPPVMDKSAGPYEIDQEAVLNSCKRNIKVLSIGAGFSGIMMAYMIQKECKNVDLVVYEKNEDIGGTWLENRYPGCGCDIPSHAYIYNFAPNPNWPNFYSYSEDIWKYLDRVCKTFDLRKYMVFKTRVTGAYWEEEDGEWRVTLTQTRADGTEKEMEERCHFLLNGSGPLNNFKWPEIKGMDKFKGRIIHTAKWPEDYQKEQWKNEKVAVIGSGASSIQTVPGMQPYVKHMDVFIRTGVWFVSLAGNCGLNKEYSEEEMEKFRASPEALVEHSKFLENQINGMSEIIYRNSSAQAEARKMMKERMAEWIKDERLLHGFSPNFSVACRRITPGDPYMKAIQEPNITVHFTAVKEFTEEGVLGADGIERKVDTVVCATGFDTSYRPRFPFVGQNGVDLRDKWKLYPESYLGLAVPGFPNTITFIGPTWPVENGSVVGPLVQVGKYAIQMIKKIQNEYIHSITPRQDVTEAFNEHVQEWVKHTVWSDNCRSWYKNNETGRVNAIWPGSSEHYIELIQEPRFEDYTITYLNKRNLWSFLGMGRTMSNIVSEMDNSPYLSVDAIDPVWLDEIQGRRKHGEADAAAEKVKPVKSKV